MSCVVVRPWVTGKLAGRAESITSSQFTAKINQGRHVVDSGGKD